MSKQAVLMVIDVGNSMDELYADNTSRLKLALSCILITVEQKVFYNSTHEVGIALFGDNDTNGAFMNLVPISKPNTELVRKISQLSQVTLKNDLKGGDIFAAIDAGIHDIQKYCSKKKLKKRMFVFTNGMGNTAYNKQTIAMMALRLNDAQIALNVIPINFMEGYVMEQNYVETEIKYEEQRQNAVLLMDLKENAAENMQIFPDQIAVELYRRFRKREVNPVAIFRGNFEFSPDLTIPVESFKMVRRQRMKSLAKYDINVPFNPQITKQKQIFIELNYIIQGDETSTNIEAENRINAYYYGPHMVPISGILETQFRLHEEKNFKLLAFVEKDKIPRAAFMGEVELVIPAKGYDNIVGQKLFTALVFGMVTLDKWAIARYVPRNSKNGVTPRLVLLMPHRTIDREGLYLVDLPTVQDVRDYPFNPLKPATQEQRQLVRQIIKNGSLYHRIDNEQHQQLRVQSTFNPAIQYFFQAVFYRAFNQDEDLPKLDPNIINYITPQARIFDNTQDIMKDVKKEFKFTKKILAKEKALKKKVLGWKQVIDSELPDTTDYSATVSEAEEGVKPDKLFNHKDDEDNFDPSNPIVSFNKMLSNNKVDLVSQAIKDMGGYIYLKSSSVLSQETMQHLIMCASTLRRGCDVEQQQDKWDEWLSTAKLTLNQRIFQGIINQGLMYFNRDNRTLKQKPIQEPQITKEQEFADLD